MSQRNSPSRERHRLMPTNRADSGTVGADLVECQKYKTFNIYSENSCSLASVADCRPQLEVITHGMPVEVTKRLALGNVTAVDHPRTP